MATGKSINIDHSTATISTTGDSVVRIGIHGALKVGDGANVSASDEGEAGAIRFKKSTTFSESSYEMHNGTQWQKLVQPVDPINAIIYSIIFG